MSDNHVITMSLSHSGTDTEAPLSQSEEDCLLRMLPLRDRALNKFMDENCDDVAAVEVRQETLPASLVFPNHPLVPVDLKTIPHKGKYLFDIKFEEEPKPPKKSCTSTFSEKCNRLFVLTNSLVSLWFHTRIPLPYCELRMFLKYKAKNEENTVVQRCPYHKGEEKKDAFVFQSSRDDAVYSVCPVTGHFVITLPQQDRRNTEIFETVKFICATSCKGGVNRRQLILVVLLVISGRIAGTVEQEIHICSSPGRDRRNAEAKLMKVDEKPTECVPTVTQIFTPSQLSSSSDEEERKRLRKITDDCWYKLHISPVRGKRNISCLIHAARLTCPAGVISIERVSLPVSYQLDENNNPLSVSPTPSKRTAVAFSDDEAKADVKQD